MVAVTKSQLAKIAAVTSEVDSVNAIRSIDVQDGELVGWVYRSGDQLVRATIASGGKQLELEAVEAKAKTDSTRPSCLHCVEKHLASAMVLLNETDRGYPEHRLLAIGHFSEAEDESAEEYPELAAEIRRIRIAYSENGEQPDFRELYDLLQRNGRYDSDTHTDGNGYHLKLHPDHDITARITHPKGSVRHGKPMRCHYGLILGTYGQGGDGQSIDVYVGNTPNNQVWRITQNHPDGEYDEDKFMCHFASRREAKLAYIRQVGSDRFGGIHPVSWEELRPKKFDGEHEDTYKPKYKVGDLKRKNGKVYRLNQNKRWQKERDAEQESITFNEIKEKLLKGDNQNLILATGNTYAQETSLSGKQKADELLNLQITKIAKVKADKQKQAIIQNLQIKLKKAAIKKLYPWFDLDLSDFEKNYPDKAATLLKRYKQKMRQQIKEASGKINRKILKSRQEQERFKVFADSPPYIQRVMDKIGHAELITPSSDMGGFYIGSDKKIHMDNYSLEDGSFTGVYQHESGHHIDGIIGKIIFEDPRPGVRISYSKEGKSARRKDSKVLTKPAFQSALNQFKDTYKEELNDPKTKGLYLSYAHQLADLAGAITGNRVGYGHGNDELRSAGVKETEAFADMFTILSSKDQRLHEIAKQIAPNTYKFVRKTIEDFVND